ncbi:MAG: Mth938-like domain-containing protein [Gallionellaceae bacterium]
MALQRTINPEQKTFTAYGEGYVAINNERFTQPIVVTAKDVFTDWGAKNFATLTAAHFDYFLPLAPEVLLLGTGNQQHFAYPALFRQLIEHGISIEFMDTRAACRTYNILVAEDRKVVAAILI